MHLIFVCTIFLSSYLPFIKQVGKLKDSIARYKKETESLRAENGRLRDELAAVQEDLISSGKGSV
jgi:hypothetical protein